MPPARDGFRRGISMAGMVLGAFHGFDGIPGKWISGMRKATEIMDLIGKLA